MQENLNVLLVGSGGREFSTAKAISESPLVNRLFIAPGNAGTAQFGANLDIAATDLDGLRRVAKDNGVHLATAGSENTFVLGFVDAMREDGILAYGVDQEQAKLETDKIFSQKVMEECGIPCPGGYAAENYDQAMEFLANPKWERFVIKASGPAGGKGVELPDDIEEARRIVREFMIDGKHGEAGKRILFQERLEGLETSLIVRVSGEQIIGEPLTNDYKLKLTGNLGPNTGGMGSIIDLGAKPSQEDLDRFVRPIAERYARDGKPLNTTMYVQLIHTKEGTKVLEFNMRDGDPEGQTKLAIKKPESDLVAVMLNSLNGDLSESDLQFDYDKAVANVVVAARGYPENTTKESYEVTGLETKLENGVSIVHAGTKLVDGKVFTKEGAGRVLNVIGVDRNLDDAVAKVYRTIGKGGVNFNGAWARQDIGKKYGSS